MTEFKTVAEAQDIIQEVITNLGIEASIETSGKTSTGLNKLVSFIILVSKDDDSMVLVDDLILLRASGYDIKEVTWQPKWGDQMDLMFVMITVTVEIKLYRK